MKLYLVFDKKAKNIVSVFSSLNDESAERSFLMLLTGPRNLFTDFPEDFALYALADLSVAGSSINVSAPNNEDLIKAGFKVDSYVINSAIKDGSDYDKRYLALVHNDRYISESEVDNKNDEQ